MTKSEEPRILPAGDSCLVADFGNIIDLEVNSRVQKLRCALEKANIQGIRELVPTYRSLAIYFDPSRVELDTFRRRIEDLMPKETVFDPKGGQVAVIPVCYGGEYGPDLENVASIHDISSEEVIRRHSGRDCYCYMLGFTPGFSYLGGMDESIATPRLANPRELIPAGSVGIAGKQTGIYPIDSPGGWQLIGRTPMRMFDPSGDPPTLLDAGLWVRFSPVSSEKYRQIEKEVRSGGYELEIVERSEA